MKFWKKITIMISGIVVILVVLLFIGNDYEMTEKRVTISTTGGDLSTVVTTQNTTNQKASSYSCMATEHKKQRKMVAINR